MLALTRELQPGILVNNRLGIPADYVTPEQYQPDRPFVVDGVEVAWEACQTLNGSWGYHRDNLEYKDPALLVRMLAQSVAAGGNMLLNVGPTGRGNLDARTRHILGEIAGWMDEHGRAIHGAGAAPYPPPPNVVYTLRGDRLYAHVLTWPLRHLHLPGLAGKIRYAQLLHDASEVPLSVLDTTPPAHANLAQPPQPEGTLTLTLPITRPDVLVPVIEMFVR